MMNWRKTSRSYAKVVLMPRPAKVDLPTEGIPQASPIEEVYNPAVVEFRKHVLAEEEPQASLIEGGL